MTKPQMPAPVKVYHRGWLVSDRAVSALCFPRPRAINLERANWTLRDDAVTCRKCLALMAKAKEPKA